jgi:alkanesulfonate monooxygenase SsuD/methylene tetrahydromethanopterin reductase-like flavin-dependent oxidoreductase (luciferase family)
VQAVQAALVRNDTQAMAQAVSEEMVDTFAAAGTADQVRARLREYEGLADSICLSPPDQLIDPGESARYREALLETFAAA